MKKFISTFAATLLLFLMVSCNQDSLSSNEGISPFTNNGSTRAEKKPLDEIDFSAIDTLYFVTDKDVEAYIHFKKLLAESEDKDFEVLEVVPMGLNDEATLAYLLNYNEGWEIIAADKRAPLLLGYDEEGRLPSENIPDNIKAWLEGVESEVLYLRTFCGRPDMADDETWENMLGSVDFWKAINTDEEFITRHGEGIRGIGDSIPHLPYLNGHWELIRTTCEENVLMSIEHLTETTWGGGTDLEIDYNMYCPQKQNSSGKVSATNPAVQGAQMAYFLHNKIGKPVNSPSSIYCTATVGNVYYENNMYIEGYTSSLWSGMNKYSPSTAVAKLMAGIVIKLRILYLTDNSYMFTAGCLKNRYFDYEGVNCSYQTYSTSVIDESLENGMPVIVEAQGFLGLNNNIGYNIIIDRYQARATQYSYVYEWIYDNADSGELLPLQIWTDVVYTNPVLEQYGMNWGLDGTCNGSWFSKSGTWIADGMTFPETYVRNMYIFEE